MGVVYEAEDLRLGRPVAVKLLAETVRRSSRSAALLLREARAAANSIIPTSLRSRGR